jgi:hypothetical protein
MADQFGTGPCITRSHRQQMYLMKNIAVTECAK